MKISTLKNKILYSINYLSARIKLLNPLLYIFFSRYKTLPKIFIIEPTNNCNGTCPLCPIGLKTTKRIGGFIDPEKYFVLIDEISSTAREVVFNFAGEPTLHPQIGNLVKYAKKKGLKVTIGTNGTIDKSQELIGSRPDEILFALDGATEETYHAYRNFPNITYEQVLSNLRNLIAEKKSLGNTTTKIILQFIVMKENESEINEIITLGKKIGVDGIDLKPVSLMAAKDYGNISAIRKYLPRNKIKQYDNSGKQTKIYQPGYCPFAFSTAVVLYDGSLSSCCYDFNGDQVFANAFANGFALAWLSPKAKEYREKIFKKQLPLCKNCGYTYKTPQRIYF